MPLQRYVATRDAEAGDRRRPHLLALGVDLRDAARAASASCATWWRTDVYEAGFDEPAPAPAQRRRPARAPAAAAMPTALPLPTRRAVVSTATAAPRCCRPRTARRAAPGAGEVRIRQRAIGVNFLDVYLRRGWIPAMLPLAPGVPGMEAAGSVIDVGAGRQRLPARRPRRLPRPGAGRLLQRAHACRPSGSCACRPRSTTTSPRRCCSRASPPTTCCATSATCGAARGCSCTRRPAASACWSAPGRAGSARS